MKPKFKPEEKGPMDRFVMKIQNKKSSQRPVLPPVEKCCDELVTSTVFTMPLTQHQLGSAPAPRQPPDKQEKRLHATHSFEWCWDGRKPTNITCDKAGTVENTLLRSEIFKGIAQKNKDRELVILKDGKVISSHFPCCLIKRERLIVRYIKAGGKPKQSFENRGYVNSWRKGPSDKPVMFHVLTKGGKNVVRIMRNPALRTNFEAITVFAYKGEKVKHALRRDGRLLNTVFKKNCVLSDPSTGVTTEMSSPVDDLDGKTFKIVLLDKSPPPESPPGSLNDAYMMQNDSLRSDSDLNQDPPQQNDNRPREKPEPEGDTAPEQNPDTMQRKISSQFKDLVKRMKTLQGSKPSRMQDFYRVEYGKNDQTCREVKTMKKLMELSNSVCHVRVNGRAGGSGFLLFDKFVLTNGHVIKNVYDEETRQLTETVTVHFSYESLDHMESGAEVEEVAGFAYYSGASGHQYDWALLKLRAEQNLPDGLLKHFGFLPPSGGICIIGHPDGGVKMIEPCLIVSFDNRSQVAERHYCENPDGVEVHTGLYHENPGHLQLVTPRFFEDVAGWVKQNKQVLTYESSFYFGSSGSPVFDEHCNVVAMHSAGYVYRNARGQSQSVIEYGFPLSVIIEQVIYQLVERGKFDVLKEYLACSCARHQNIMSNLKKLVEGRNLTAFRNAANSPEVINDASLKKFFDFLCRPEDPDPMDTD
ncbi:protein FAM111A-like [Acanthopagrus latus]|uniref:protein FAM111A-like n=1 Tax=Acanthopagrus latus TaxID=8177 RepID=UPI00187CF09D|nr:protein FAM111A-like [Acanthopagrus latus]XP_036975859.1 protein FAM111A-like [Acanthopagrus latus]